MNRNIKQIITAQSVSDGAGVRLQRSLGFHGAMRVDPFLMLDEFSSANPDDYLAGFPSHPHRGFETVTYMLQGNMRHEDHLGNQGLLKDGGVQWMTAGAGIIHSEMPEQQSGVMHGFQLWINLAAAEKMKPAGYVDIQKESIPEVVGQGWRVKLIAGSYSHQQQVLRGPIAGITTEPVFLDVHLEADQSFAYDLPRSHNGFVYVYEGTLDVHGTGEVQKINPQQAGVLGDGITVSVTAHERGARFLLLAAKPIGEPVVQYGPFVMNTEAEIHQAISDFQNRRFAVEA